MKAVILAGGLGTRLLPYTKTLPKPMLLLGKKPILEYVIKWIKKNGIRDIVLCVSYKRKKIEGSKEEFFIYRTKYLKNKLLLIYTV